MKDDFIIKIKAAVNEVYKFKDMLIGSLAVDKSLELASMLAYVREKEALARASYHTALWEKLKETENDKPLTFAKAEAYAKAQPSYYEFLSMQGLAESLLELSYSLRVKGRTDDKELSIN